MTVDGMGGRVVPSGAAGPGRALDDDLVRSVVDAHRHERGALLPVLHDLLERTGCIDPRAVPVIADELNLSRADVHGVVSFYRDFRAEPPGATVVRICRAEACQAVGAESLAAHARRRLGLDFGETSADGRTTLDQVFCLGNCALGPSVTVGGRLGGRVTADRLDALIAAAAGAS